MKQKNNRLVFDCILVNRKRNTLGRATFVALLFLLKAEIGAQTFAVRALWVVRDHILTEEKIDHVLNFAEDNNYNHLWLEPYKKQSVYILFLETYKLNYNLSLHHALTQLF